MPIYTRSSSLFHLCLCVCLSLTVNWNVVFKMVICSFGSKMLRNMVSAEWEKEWEREREMREKHIVHISWWLLFHGNGNELIRYSENHTVFNFVCLWKWDLNFDDSRKLNFFPLLVTSIFFLVDPDIDIQTSSPHTYEKER